MRSAWNNTPRGLANVARTLDVAAPTLAVDEGAPWTNARGASQWTLASIFWLTFHGLSTMLHGMAVFFSVGATLLPIPFIAGMCALTDPDVKPIERVEMAIVEVKPPPPEPVVAPVVEEADAVEEVVAIKPKKKAKVAKDVLVNEVHMMKLLGSMNDDNVAVFGVLSARTDDNVLGGLIGNSIGDSLEGGVEGGVAGGVVGGDSYGYGGLGLRGVGEGGGGTGLGLGGLGTVGIGSVGTGTVEKRKVTVELDGATAAQLRRIASGLETCNVKEQLLGSVVVVDGRVTKVTTTPKEPCVERRVRLYAGTFETDGEMPLIVTPKD